MKQQRQKQQLGFSLIELIGVLAIIAILGSIAAPKILSSIEDSKVQAVVQDTQRLSTVVLQFYRDTARFPIHIPTSDGGVVANQRLISNTGAIPGWKGPYLDSELSNPYKPAKYYIYYGAFPFDLNGDGVDDYTTNSCFLVIEQIDVGIIQAISDAIDQDGDVITGTGAWYTSGKVRTRSRTAKDTSVFIMLSAQD